LTIAGCSRELPPGERNNFHPFGVQHASLHLEYFGETRGTEDLYEDSSGLREAHYVHSEIITEKAFQPTITCTIRDLTQITVVDSVKLQEVRLIDKPFDSLFHLPYGDVPTPDGQFASFIKRGGYSLHGDTDILAGSMDIKAHVWRLNEEESNIYEFKGLIIGRKTVINGHESDLRLLSIDTTSPIDPARFVPQHGFRVMDMTKTMMNQSRSQP
jgi:hypothetical protein